MTAPETPSPTPARSQIQQEAATWFSRMRGPNADSYRAEFDAWLARGAQHLGAYNRAAEIWSMGKFLAETGMPEKEPASDAAPFRTRHPVLIALSVCLACIVLASGWFILSELGHVSRSGATEMADRGTTRLDRPLQLATMGGETRNVRLADGSTVTLQPNALLTVSFDTVRRGLQLKRGSARFEVAHEARPFVVAAGGGSVTARGTVFDVSISSDNRVTVKLLRGSVDVAIPAASRPAVRPAPVVRPLAPGESVDFADGRARPLPNPTTRSGSEPGATIDLDHSRLADLVATANRHSAVQIGLGDSELGNLRASGVLRVDDPERLAAYLASVFDLTVERPAPSRILLKRR
jgi:transmembrane sensor